MKIIQGVKSLAEPFSRSVLTIGNFDGVHLGHRELIRRVLERSLKTGAPSIVMTFEPHPVQVLYPDRHLKRIFSFEDQRRELERLGVEYLVIEPFSREFSQLSAELYIQEWIYKPFMPELVVVGYDFTFGANRSGTQEFLKTKAEDFGFDLVVVPPVKIGEHLVSSSLIRRTLAAGDVALAAELLGRRFYFEGIVEKGAGRGRTIGIPTANLRTMAETIPSPGVYAAIATTRDGQWAAAVNIGRNPTFHESEPEALFIEAHLLGFQGDIYGEEMRLEFVTRLRDEMKFSSVPDLVRRIQTDIKAVERLIGEKGRPR